MQVSTARPKSTGAGDGAEIESGAGSRLLADVTTVIASRAGLRTERAAGRVSPTPQRVRVAAGSRFDVRGWPGPQWNGSWVPGAVRYCLVDHGSQGGSSASVTARGSCGRVCPSGWPGRASVSSWQKPRSTTSRRWYRVVSHPTGRRPRCLVDDGGRLIAPFGDGGEILRRRSPARSAHELYPLSTVRVPGGSEAARHRGGRPQGPDGQGAHPRIVDIPAVRTSTSGRRDHRPARPPASSPASWSDPRERPTACSPGSDTSSSSRESARQLG